MRALNHRRRKYLLAATALSGGTVAGATALALIQSMAPSEAARAAGAAADVDLGQLEEGSLMTVEWRGRPVWILHRSPAMIATLRAEDERLADPRSQRSEQPPYATNPTRSMRPRYMVMLAICTHLGCVPVFRPGRQDPESGPDGQGGFYCPCHGSRFDLAGRVFKNVPAPTNLEVPPYRFLDAQRLRVGEDDAQAGPA